LCVGKKNNHTNLQNLTHYQRQYSTKGENVTVCQSSFTEIIRNRLTHLASRCSHSRSCADVGENVKSVDGYSQRSQHVSMIHKRHTHTHTHTSWCRVRTHLLVAYTAICTRWPSGISAGYARSAKAQRPAAMLCVCRDVSAFDARGQMNQKKNKLLQYWQRNAASLLPPTEQGWE